MKAPAYCVDALATACPEQSLGMVLALDYLILMSFFHPHKYTIPQGFLVSKFAVLALLPVPLA